MCLTGLAVFIHFSHTVPDTTHKTSMENIFIKCLLIISVDAPIQ